MKALYETDLQGFNLVRKGKVRDVYDLGENLLFVATDRISAFDVIMRQPVPQKGAILSRISAFWFAQTGHLIKNHFQTMEVTEYPEKLAVYRKILKDRSMIVAKATPFPIECVVRGYLAGSGWKEYQSNRAVCGIDLPEGLVQYGQLPEPIYTPATKAESGHDENISFEQSTAIIGEKDASFLRDISLKIYKFAHEFMLQRGIILADTKFEFGKNSDGEIILIDEVLTPDSSRFWLKETYKPGEEQYNFDKQILRDYLETIAWNKQAPAPELPDEILYFTLEKYKKAYELITGDTWESE
ncbi:MAG: phosphoribosylaminoimidazolesuccinocarboxamide synthase [Desulfobulbaceae bacterium]|nr:phosphoribosylaminoimidazolesuccinocarboxamide synthase [Candidatus Kapabacteria bacterium]MBS4000040.1 phosphoribosylaminoimidazolesuccinocarboxamide synthase [Desulfobulbaceae bacterium]